MKIALFDIDGFNYPNIALMKISQFHKNQGDNVEWWNSLLQYDKVYGSKIFTFTDGSYIRDEMMIGGTGWDIKKKLPDKIDNCKLDYSLYPELKTAIGFLTRGCIRKCPECVVPEKEGYIKPYRDIEEVLQGRTEAVLLDNNILACDYGLEQIEKIVKLGIKVDFNQGLDARLITDDIAKLLSKVKWIRFVRMACDNLSMIEPLRKAIELLKKYDRPSREYFIYVLVKDIETALERVEFCRELDIKPFAQPYRNIQGDEPKKKLKHYARWVNHKALFKSTSWKDYKYNFEKAT